MVTWLGVTGRVVSETGYTLDRTGGLVSRTNLQFGQCRSPLKGGSEKTCGEYLLRSPLPPTMG